MKMFLTIPIVILIAMIVTPCSASEELAKEINHISSIAGETKSEILCVNNRTAFIYENDVTKEIKIEQGSVTEYFGKVTIDYVIETICR